MRKRRRRWLKAQRLGAVEIGLQVRIADLGVELAGIDEIRREEDAGLPVMQRNRVRRMARRVEKPELAAAEVDRVDITKYFSDAMRQLLQRAAQGRVEQLLLDAVVVRMQR